MRAQDKSVLTDNFWYDKAWLTMKWSGILSWFFGGLGVLFLVIGLYFFFNRVLELLEVAL